MTERKMTVLGAVVLGALLAGPVGAAGVGTPASVSDAGGPADAGGWRAERDSVGGRPHYPSLNQPASVPDANPAQTGREYQSPPMRDSRLTPSPRTPAGVNEAAPSETGREYTNSGGTANTGATR